MKIHTEQLYPWADVAKALTTMKRLIVKVGDVTHEGWFDLSQDDAGTVTLAFEARSGWEDKPDRSVVAEWKGTESVEPAEPKARKRK